MPASKTINDLGTTSVGECKIALPDVCIAEVSGPVKLIHVVDDDQKIYVCLKCVAEMVRTGQWVEKQ